jgi:hypothetical protein
MQGALILHLQRASDEDIFEIKIDVTLRFFSNRHSTSCHLTNGHKISLVYLECRRVDDPRQFVVQELGHDLSG